MLFEESFLSFCFILFPVIKIKNMLYYERYTEPPQTYFITPRICKMYYSWSNVSNMSPELYIFVKKINKKERIGSLSS